MAPPQPTSIGGGDFYGVVRTRCFLSVSESVFFGKETGKVDRVREQEGLSKKLCRGVIDDGRKSWKDSVVMSWTTDGSRGKILMSLTTDGSRGKILS